MPLRNAHHPYRRPAPQTNGQPLPVQDGVVFDQAFRHVLDLVRVCFCEELIRAFTDFRTPTQPVQMRYIR
jgi:hypothetical protein